MERTISKAAQKIEAFARTLNLTMTTTFVPFSLSRNAKPKGKEQKVWRSLNWKVSIWRGENKIIETDYSAGEAHCPSYKQGAMTVQQKKDIDFELEHGFSLNNPEQLIEPELSDVLGSLGSDADVLDYGRFEDWADSLGLKTDSRDAERMYRASLEIALQLKNAIGIKHLVELQELAHEL